MSESHPMIIVQQPTSDVKSAEQPLREGTDDGRGLEKLMQSDFIRVRQKINRCEICCTCEMKNKYKLSNAQGETIFKAEEHSCCLYRNCCGDKRGFEMVIRDELDGRNVLRLQRPCRCHFCCLPCCCLQTMDVYFADGNHAGKVQQLFTCSRPKFEVLDQNNKVALAIEGPCHTCTCCLICRSVGFEIHQDGKNIGILRKEHSGAAKEALTDADNFYVTFPRELPIDLRATLIGAVFLLDFAFFE